MTIMLLYDEPRGGLGLFSQDGHCARLVLYSTSFLVSESPVCGLHSAWMHMDVQHLQQRGPTNVLSRIRIGPCFTKGSHLSSSDVGVIRPRNILVCDSPWPQNISNSRRVLRPRIVRRPRRFKRASSRLYRWQISVALGNSYQEHQVTSRISTEWGFFFLW